MAVISEVFVKLTAEEAWTWLASLLAAPSCSNETVSRMLSALGTRLSVSWRARSLTYEEGSEGAHHEADSIPSRPAPAAPAATETAYQGGRNSGWTCQPCPIDWTVWLHYSCLCRGRSPQTTGVRSQLVVHMHGIMHARLRSLAVDVYCAVYSLPCVVVCMYSCTYRTDCMVCSRPSRAAQSRAGSGS